MMVWNSYKKKECLHIEGLKFHLQSTCKIFT
jgi:hypothetical protein